VFEFNFYLTSVPAMMCRQISTKSFSKAAQNVHGLGSPKRHYNSRSRTPFFGGNDPPYITPLYGLPVSVSKSLRYLPGYFPDLPANPAVSGRKQMIGSE